MIQDEVLGQDIVTHQGKLKTWFVTSRVTSS